MNIVYYSSRAIINLFHSPKFQIEWLNGNLANKQGNVLTPTPAMGLFYQYYINQGKLFTQQEYYEFCICEWEDWWNELPPDKQEGLKCRLYRNFYPSGIDTLHVYSLMIEHPEFHKCLINPTLDAVAKIDIVCWDHARQKCNVGLRIHSQRSQDWAKYKDEHRPQGNVDIYLELPMDRNKDPGNKRWYERKDLNAIIDFWDEKAFQTA